MLKELRQSVDAAGLGSRTILAVGDASFCNRTPVAPALDRLDILARSRRDCRLCHAVEPGGRRFYSTEVFTPDQIRLRESLPWQQARIFHGGKWRDVRYKEVTSVYWRSGAAKRPLRLLVVAPVPYDSGKGQRRNARRPSCLDLITQLRQEVASSNGSTPCSGSIGWKTLVMAAAA